MGATPDIVRQELARIALWPLTPRSVRAAVLMIAGLPRERAGDTLDSFNANERHLISLAGARLAGDAAVIADCANPMLAAH